MVFSALILPMLPAVTTAGESLREFEETLRQAKQGDAAAQVQVGIAYDSGRWVEKDPDKALGW